jgi:hypothetical protein
VRPEKAETYILRKQNYVNDIMKLFAQRLQRLKNPEFRAAALFARQAL